VEKRSDFEKMGLFQLSFITTIVILNPLLFVFLWFYSDFNTALNHFADMADTFAKGMFVIEPIDTPNKPSLPPESPS